MSIDRLRRLISVALIVGLVAGCADEPLPTAPRVTAADVIAAVTADVAAQLDDHGRFVLAGPRDELVPSWVTPAVKERVTAVLAPRRS